MDIYKLVNIAVIASVFFCCGSVLLLLPYSVFYTILTQKRKSRLFHILEDICMFAFCICFIIALFGEMWLKDENLQRSYISAGYTIINHEISANSSGLINSDDNLILEKDGKMYWADCEKTGKSVELFLDDEIIAFGERHSIFTLLIKASDRTSLTLNDYLDYQSNGDLYICTYS